MQAPPAPAPPAETATTTPDSIMSAPYWQKFLDTDVLGAIGLKVMGAILFLVAAWIIGAWLRRAVRKALERAKVEGTLSKFLANIARWALMILSIVACLGIFGVQTASFAAVIGSAGLAVGLALQGSLSHLAAGVLLLLTRPFKAGDTVIIAGQLGTVDEIELFATHLDTADGRRVIIPNGQVFGSVIENITHHALRRIDIPVGLEYGADLEETSRTLLAAAASVPGRIADRPPEVIVRQFGPTTVDWQVSVWATRETFGNVRQSLIRAVKSAIESARIAVPLPPLAPHLRRA